MAGIKNRSEVVFLYDIKDANPNGDPMDENKPRIDEDTDINIVTDVRLKRTIRDYLAEFKNKDIFIIEEIKEDGTQKTREERIKDLKIETKEDELKLLEKYIDLRLFGATIALKKEKEKERGKSITWIGPVQFRFGRSMHKVEPKIIKGTSVLPSREDVTAGTFIETQVLYYGLISFYGLINENAAKTTNLTEEDIELLLDGMWNGTKNLITRSKVGQIPRFLLRVIYKEKNYHIGDLEKKIKLVYAKDNREVTDGKEIRDISEVKLSITNLINTLKENKDKIEKIQYEVNSDVVFLVDNNDVKGAEIEDKLKIDEIPVERLNLDKVKEK
ncbi:MAG: type I-B CRISPR-associated protein Cas7/Csh2 [Thermoplasmata archaeon]